MTTDLTTSNSLTDLREGVRTEHVAVGMALRDCVQHAMAAGDFLIEAKRQIGKHGAWLPWLDSCGLSERTAQRYMRLARNRALIEANPTSVSDLTMSGALALLAVPRRSLPSSMTDHLAGIVEPVADAMLGFFEVEKLDEASPEREKQRALLDEARAAVESVGELITTPELAEIVEQDAEGFCSLITERAGKYQEVALDAMGLTQAEYASLLSRIDELRARGAGDGMIAFVLSREFDFNEGYRSPYAAQTALVRSVRDAAVGWLNWVARLAEAPPP